MSENKVNLSQLILMLQGKRKNIFHRKYFKKIKARKFY